MIRILVVAALKQELAPLQQQLKHPAIQWLQTGVGPDRAAQAIHDASAADLIISTGCCGALAPELAAGDLVIPQRICSWQNQTVHQAPPPAPRHVEGMRAAAKRLLHGFKQGALITSHEPLRTPPEKQVVLTISGAVAVDMETSAIAAEASARDIPYVSVRVVLDTSTEFLPDPPENQHRVGFAAKRPRRGILQASWNMVTVATLRARLKKISAPLAICINDFCLTLF